MSTTRNLAMADLDTQIQQAQLFAVPPSLPPLSYNASGFTGARGVRGAETTPMSQERTTSSYPTERLFESEPETLRLVNPMANPTLSPNIGPPPPPPKSSQNAKADAEKAQRQQAQAQRMSTQQVIGGVSAGLGAVKTGLQNRAQIANSWLANIPTPGDVWVPFFILLILFLIIIPVKGHTRMMWLWLVIIGHAHIGTPFASQNSQAQEAFQALSASAGQNQGQTLTGTIPANYPIQTYTYNSNPPPSTSGSSGLQLGPPSNPGPSGGPVPFVNYLTTINQEY